MDVESGQFGPPEIRLSPVAGQGHEGGPPLFTAPLSTVDFSLANGSGIPIEERAAEEVTHANGVRLAPEGVAVCNPAFDVTPAEYVTAIITDKGVAYPPYRESLRALAEFN